MIEQSTAILITAALAFIFGILGCFIGFYMFMKELSKIKYKDVEN